LRQTDGISVKRNLKERLSESRTLINFSANLEIIQRVQEKKNGSLSARRRKGIKLGPTLKIKRSINSGPTKKKILKEKKPGPI
jgi:hypothetical protein